MDTSVPSPDTVLLVNPNTNGNTTTMMVDLAEESLAPHGLRVVGITAAAGPSMIVDPVSLSESEAHVRNAVRNYLSGPDGGRVAAVIVAAIGDPGRAQLDDELNIPVIGIGQGSVYAAAQNSHGALRHFGMATSTPLLTDALGKLVADHGFQEQFTGVRLTLSEPLVLAADPERQFQELAQAVTTATESDKAEAVIIAGGPLSATARRLAKATAVDIIQPIPSACQLVLTALS
ncbi:aspartate/glutamate racemase family protein [Arthrobacter sp. Rue61a]|jgi:Asp/Glu/hydantoin racemase|uniref:Hydantoin racemase n=1 Tax=Paenarthrobacter aurescens (strain TC1) TaxID=290340 RepID=A1RA47_PAEAT|nr:MULTISPECIES: aspartate/glutamate racemase family protein [Micrococcaceae]ABM10191.1 putative hydantoin racemase [Paenarthrobacter aurescens TC1]AFR30431.1 Asp/Glu/hydantoin racemase superfamily protein [Arthrobacter sp. Rue61a]